MKDRIKHVDLEGHRFQLRRLPPDVGSFIFMKMLGVSMRAPSAKPDEKKASSKPDEKKEDPAITGEQRIRALSFAVFSGGITFEEYQFVQRSCLKAVSKIAPRSGVDFPMPLMNDDGVWAFPELEDDIRLAMRLTTELLTFCFADFFDETGSGSLL